MSNSMYHEGRHVTYKPSEDIRSVTDLKRNTRDILDHLHATGRPVILTGNGRADSVLLDTGILGELEK